MRGWRPWLLASLAAIPVGSCGGPEPDPEQSRPVPPTTAELSRFAAETRLPAYWLGPRFRGITVSDATVEGREVRLTYGPWECDFGCTDAGGISTRRREVRWLSRYEYEEDPGLDLEDCWTRIGKAVAVLLSCLPDESEQQMLIYSGTREISVTSLYTSDGQGEIPVQSVVRGLRPLNARARWPLGRPEPWTCRELKRIDPRYRRHMPRVLRPRAAC